MASEPLPDAEFLRNLIVHDKLVGEPLIGDRLRQIAENIEELLRARQSDFAKGYHAGEAAYLARSNVTGKRPDIQPNLAAAIASYMGEVQVVNKPKKVDMQDVLTVDDLDLDL